MGIVTDVKLAVLAGETEARWVYLALSADAHPEDIKNFGLELCEAGIPTDWGFMGEQVLRCKIGDADTLSNILGLLDSWRALPARLVGYDEHVADLAEFTGSRIIPKPPLSITS
jgi:hypothetical protein